MTRLMFFMFGIPRMILSFYQAVDVLPFVQSSGVIVDGKEMSLTESQQTELETQIFDLLQNSHTLPAFGVVFDDMFQQQISKGNFVFLKFDRILELNGLPFDELVFAVDPEAQAFDFVRGVKGVYQGRCIHIDLQGSNMKNFSLFVDELIKELSQEVNFAEGPVQESTEEQGDVEQDLLGTE